MMLLSLLMLASAAAPASEPGPVLRVEVPNLRGNRGDLIVMVFPESAAGDYPTKYASAIVTRTVRLSEHTGPIVVEGLAPGRYALRVHHDENADGKLQKRLFRPQEGLAFSSGAKLRWNGPPKFKDAVFELAGEVTQRVVMTYP
jgi:uncharacterized protein (DUF2141 family)